MCQFIAIGADAGLHRVAALLLAHLVLPAGHVDTRDQPPHVPFPQAWMGFVEVVEVEHEFALG